MANTSPEFSPKPSNDHFTSSKSFIEVVIKNKAQAGRFLIVGAVATALDFGILFTATHFGMPTLIANILSTGVSFCFSFLANKHYTFKTHGSNLKREITLFVVITLFGLWVLQSIVIHFTEPALAPISSDEEIRLLIAKLLATIVTTIWNFVLYSRVVFVHDHRDEKTKSFSEQ